MCRNTLPCGSGATIDAVYPTVCIISQSFAPNSQNNWNDKLGHESIHVIRVGGVIAISCDRGGPSVTRQQRLKSRLAFNATLL